MSSYVASVMGIGESVQCEAKVSIWSLLPLLVLGVVLVPFYGLGVIAWVAAYLRYIGTELAVTNRKIIAKTGVIRRDTIEMLLERVESVQVRQSLLGRLLNYGSVIVSGAGTPQAPIVGISDPLGFRGRFMAIQEETAAAAQRLSHVNTEFLAWRARRAAEGLCSD